MDNNNLVATPGVGDDSAMNWTELHLALNHVPVIGVPFLMALLVWGLFRRSGEIVRLAHGWLILLSVVSIAIKFTGDFAADQSKDRLAPSQAQVERHEQSADQATTGLFLLGLVAALALFAGRRKPLPPRWAGVLVLIVGFATCILLTRTARAGGQIGHPELRSAPVR